MFNKIAGAVLGTFLVLLALRIVAEELFLPEEPETVLTIAGVEGGQDGETQDEGAVVDMMALIAAADPTAGRAVAARCSGCHTFDEGGGTLVGPNLYDVVGASVAHLEGFDYSEAFVALRDEGAEWTYERLDAFLTNPMAAVPGTAMAFPGVPDNEDRAAVIAYLRTLSSDPVPPPAAEASPPPEATPPAESPAGEASPPASEAAPAAENPAGEASEEPAPAESPAG